MKENDWKKVWLEEEKAAYIHGWDFSHIAGRYTEEDDLPWDYRAITRKLLEPEFQILDMETGGGEFLLSLGHPCGNTAAMEGYPPNVVVCRERLLPLGIDFREGDGEGELPFESGRFDLILNRHGSYNIKELWRCLKPGGFFLTEQVGGDNDRELVELLLPGTGKPFPDNTLEIQQRHLKEQGFFILKGQEAFRPIRFFDVGALVRFARVLPWEFPGFSVESCLNRLMEAQSILEEKGAVSGTIHRFLLLTYKG